MVAAVIFKSTLYEQSLGKYQAQVSPENRTMFVSFIICLAILANKRSGSLVIASLLSYC